MAILLKQARVVFVEVVLAVLGDKTDQPSPTLCMDGR